MAGYFRKLVGRVYNGSYVADDYLENGMFVKVDDGLVVPYNDLNDSLKFRCVEKTTLWGMPALVFDIIGQSNVPIYMVENDFPVAESGEYDETKFEVKPGEFVKMKMPIIGEQIVVSFDADFDDIEVGDTNFAVDGSYIVFKRPT